MLGIEAHGAYHIDQTPRYFFSRVALVTGTPYTLTIADTSGRQLYREEDTLTRFLSWLAGRGCSSGTLFSERAKWTQEGSIALLEFLPAKAGAYRFTLNIQSRIEDETPGSSSFCEVTGAEVTFMEDVSPLSGIVKYPHKRVHV
jgi:hypothetical protein